MFRRGTGHLACPLLLLVAVLAQAQDLRTVTSPDGKLEFRIYSAAQQEISLYRLTYQLSLEGKPLIEPSFLGLNILDEEPILGENVGLISATRQSTPKYNSLLAKYVQNGSTGRSINVEVRVYNDGVALRYIIPKSALLEDIDINAELTEFRVPGFTATARNAVPFKAGRIQITEAALPGWPMLRIKPLNATTLITDTHHAGVTPVISPWRIIAIGQSQMLNDFPDAVR